METLVIQTAFIGDALLSIPLLKKLNTIEKNQITLVCRKGLGPVLKALGLVHSYHEVDKSKSSSLSEIYKVIQSNEFDLLVSPHESLRSAYFSFRVKAKRKIGFSHWYSWWAFDQHMKRPLHLPDALRQLSLFKLVDSDFSNEFQTYEQFQNLNSQTTVHSFLNESFGETVSMNRKSEIMKLDLGSPVSKFVDLGANFALISPGSVWATKRWKKEGFAELSQSLDLFDEIYFIGSPEEKSLAEEIISISMKGKNLCGQFSLLESLYLMAHGKVLVTNDSGAMHMSSVAGLPCVSIFGPTVLSIGYRPWQNKSIVVQKELECRPCGIHGHQKCPIGTHDCMKQIQSEDVITAIEKVLSH